ncbi:uncharacterized protein LOC134740637 [Cydia strobilella]|uniref:uncharacterized protein LOC134740637 n=1 Tax=Cydia strobilella TaxID=1100964 RepID=UPI0030054020
MTKYQTDMLPCHHFHPDNVFNRFEMIEVPTSFVELSTSIDLDVGIDLNTSAYFKTTCNGLLMKFEDARDVSPSHRAYKIEQINNGVVKIIFNPGNECITKAKHDKKGNQFVFDLRLIRVDGTRCCNKEFHSEIGRYYICGHYEYCDIAHYPDVVDFGDVVMNTAVTRHVRIRNNSNVIAAKFYFIKAPGFFVTPASFTIAPNACKCITISIKPVCFQFKHCCTFKIKNPDDEFIESSIDENSLTYDINVKLNVIPYKKQKISIVESLHTLIEPETKYTYVGEEIEKHLKQKAKAMELLQLSKASKRIVPTKEKFCTGTVRCYSEESVKINLTQNNKYNFCKRPPKQVNTYDVFNVFILPFSIDFGRVGVDTYGEDNITIINNTDYEITINLCKDDYILYTEDKVRNLKLKLVPFTEARVKVLRRGFVEGLVKQTFDYTIDNKYHRKHPYKLQVGTPTVLVQDKFLKFGMVTNESFIISVPLKISNYFNVPVTIHWEGITSDTPFEIIPKRSLIPSRTSKMSDVIYACKLTKSKVHEVELFSNDKKVIPVELSVITRKLSIKFLQPTVQFKDIALNLETVERVKLENSSREVAVFYVIEPLIPGLKIEPMSGAIRPKMIITFEIIVQIPCVLEFAFDIYVKINNKENLILPVSGNVLEPKILISPKNIYMARIPCNMVTYVPVTFQNLSTLRSVIEVIDTGDDNIFNVYIAVGYEKQRIFKFCVEAGQSRTVFIRVYDVFRREYEMYIPFKINELLGPPDHRSSSTELRHYIGEHEEQYKNNSKVKLKSLNKDISFCRIIGVITVPWIQISVDEFEMDYRPNGNNIMEFTITNISKYYLYVAILTSKLVPNFSLNLQKADNSIITDTHIKFELDRGRDAQLSVKFHPKGRGKHVATAFLYLDKQMTIPYYNLTFIGRKQTPIMTPSTYRIIFPPCQVRTSIRRTFTVILEEESTLDRFYFVSKEESIVTTNFISCEIINNSQKNHTVVTVEVIIFSENQSFKNVILSFCHECGSGCDIELSFCFTYCPLTLHSNFLVHPEDHPYPYFPLDTQRDLYEYMNTCVDFLEKWMFQQGFRRDLYPVIPDTFHAISSSLTGAGAGGGTKTKGINVSFLNFIRRAAGPLMKHIHKVSGSGVDESFRSVKEIHDTYKEVINLLKYRGVELWGLQAKFLLSYEQFSLYCEYVAPTCNADIILTQELLADISLFRRLSKQSWVDFVLQSYKAFIMDSCFFECVCVTSQPRNVVDILIGWYNEQIRNRHINLRGKDKPVKLITNITSDLSDGIAVISAIMNYCSFLKDYFAIFSEVNGEEQESDIINNACLIMETLNQLKINFPITSKDFLRPNFLQMLFFSVHLFVALPMFIPKGYVQFNPPILRTSTRQVAISTTTQESLILNCSILNNNKNNFAVEKAAAGDNSKKLYVSIKYTANFVEEENAILLVHGYNKTRIFDTYIIFTLHGLIGALIPHRKCRVTGPLYRPNKVDVLVGSPFFSADTYTLYITDTEPTIPVKFEESTIPKFYVQRLCLIDKEMYLPGLPKESGQEVPEHKLYMQIICLSVQIGNSWIWFRGELGDFFIKVTTQPRWDSPLDTIQASYSWPADSCGSGRCGESCECYRTTTLMIPHRNELMVKALRYALVEHASPVMMNLFDNLIDSSTGKMILEMLLADDGTNMSDVRHILQNEIGYNISSRALSPRKDYVRLAHHTSAILALPVSVPEESEKNEKHNVILTSDCGMDIRTYRIIFINNSQSRDEM